jgi:hypothetical protein
VLSQGGGYHAAAASHAAGWLGHSLNSTGPLTYADRVPAQGGRT